MIRWLVIGVGSLVAIGAIVAMVGLFLPKGHVASGSAVIAAPRERVFAVIANVDDLPSWRSDLTSVERLPDDGTGPRYIEKGRSGAITFRVEVSEPPVRLVTRIADPSLPFGGSWTFTLERRGETTLVTIVEAGEVYNPIFRVMQRVFFSPTKTIEVYLRDLAAFLYTSKNTVSSGP